MCFCVLGCASSSCFGAKCSEWPRYGVFTELFSYSLCTRYKNSDVVISSSNKGAQACHHVGSSCRNTDGKSFYLSLLIMAAHRTDRCSRRQSLLDCRLFEPFLYMRVSGCSLLCIFYAFACICTVCICARRQYKSRMEWVSL